jgi:hypothetical protein
MTQKIAPTLTWEEYRNQITASAPIGNGKKAAYIIYYIDFGYGGCYRCLRDIVDANTDINDVDFNNGIEIAGYIHTDKEAKEKCREDLLMLTNSEL